MADRTAAATGRFDIAAVAASLPQTAETLLVDRYLTDTEAAQRAVFRVYSPHAAGLSRQVRRVSLRLLRYAHVSDGGPGVQGGVRSG